MPKRNSIKYHLKIMLSISLILSILLPYPALAALPSGPMQQPDPANQCMQSLLLLFQGKLTEVKPALEQAVDALQQSASANTDALGMCAIYLGIIHHSTGNWIQALRTYHIALEAFQKGANHQMEWTTLFGIGSAYLAQGRFDVARQTLQQALPLTGGVSGDKQEALCLKSLALEATGETHWSAAGLKPLARAVTLNNIGLVMAAPLSQDPTKRDKSAYEPSRNCFQAALQILQQISTQAGSPNDLLTSLLPQLMFGGQGADALSDLLINGLLSSITPALADAFQPILMSNLGQVYAFEGDYKQAQTYLEQALQAIRANQAQNNTGDLAAGLSMLDSLKALPGLGADPTIGNLFSNLPDLLNAMTLLNKVINLNGEGLVLNNLALVYNAQNQTAKAQQTFEHALDIFENKLANYPGAINAHVNLGYLAQQADKTDDALVHYEQAIQALASVRSVAEGGAVQLREGNPETLNFVGLQGILSQQADVYALAANLYLQKGETGKAFQAIERGRARLFFDMISTSTARLPDKDAQLLTAVRDAFDTKIQATISLTQLRSMGVTTPALLAQGKQTLQNAETLYNAQLAALKAGNPELLNLAPGVDSTIDLKTLQTKVLGKDTTLIVYYIAEGLLVTPTNQLAVAWVIDEKTVTAVKLKTTGEKIRNNVAFLRGSIEHQIPADDVAGALYADLVAPLNPYIHHNNLVIVPHGSLHYLPFAALWDATNKHYLLQDYTITYVPSASILPLSQVRRNPNQNRLLVMANNPDGSLPEANSEAKAVAQQYKATPLLDKQATKASFLKNANKYDLIHVAAHGHYDVVNPLASSIELAATGTITGSLPVSEVFGLSLSNANLVVLSACKTDLGAQSMGDEITGLTRAFLYAGTPSIITTLWSIEDKASGTLMISFYQHLRTEKSSVAAALRAAQLEVLNKDGWHDPYYWAAFTLNGDYLGSGDPKPLPTNLFQDNSND